MLLAFACWHWPAVAVVVNMYTFKYLVFTKLMITLAATFIKFTEKLFFLAS